MLFRSGIDKSCPVKAHTLAHMNLSVGVSFDRMFAAKLYVYLDGGCKELDYCEDCSPHSTWGVCVVAEYHDGTQAICLSAGGFPLFSMRAQVIVERSSLAMPLLLRYMPISLLV